jgi:hypothetical protein
LIAVFFEGCTSEMSRNQSIDRILSAWTYDPETVNVRVVRGDDGRDVVQMRVDMGLLQMEVTGRPDGHRPHGYETYFDYLVSRTIRDEDFELNEAQSLEVDREFAQFYHRRVCWLTLREFGRAINDADHTLALMDFCLDHSPDDEWAMTHEQYRPFVLFHRIHAAAMEQLEHDAAEAAVHTINAGLDQLRELFVEHDVEELYDDNELVARLTELRESLRDHYHVGQTLQEQLQDAVSREQYELAAKLRDELARRQTRLSS